MGITEGGALVMLAGLAGLAFAGYVTFKVLEKRADIRKTVMLIDEKNAGFVDGLDQLIKSGELCPA